MSNPYALQTSSEGVATVVVVVPPHQSAKEVQIARALETAALALYSRAAPGYIRSELPGEEAALMRRVEAEVYGTD